MRNKCMKALGLGAYSQDSRVQEVLVVCDGNWQKLGCLFFHLAENKFTKEEIHAHEEFSRQLFLESVDLHNEQVISLRPKVCTKVDIEAHFSLHVLGSEKIFKNIQRKIF